VCGRGRCGEKEAFSDRDLQRGTTWKDNKLLKDVGALANYLKNGIDCAGVRAKKKKQGGERERR